MKLTDAKLRTLKEPGKYFDGGGLHLTLTKEGGRYWRLKYRHGGKEKLLSLGVYPAVGLKEARDRANQARDLLAEGKDPGQVRKQEKAQKAFEAANTLESVATDWMAHTAASWTTQTAQRIRATLEADVFPKLGARPIAGIRASEIMAIVKTIEKRAPDQAGRVLQRVKSIYRYAATHEIIETNPMLDLVTGDILKPRDVQHRLSLSDRQLPEFLQKLDDYAGDQTTKAAFKLLLLTACRPGEVRGAKWSEFDLEAAQWVIPAERMKMKTEHRITLSRQALAVLREMLPLSGGRELVFPSPYYPSKPISENTFNSALARMGFKGVATSHGFRSTFSTVANEAGFRSDVIEKCLAHEARDKVRAAYNNAAYTAERAELLQWYADYLDAKKAGNVVPIGRKSMTAA